MIKNFFRCNSENWFIYDYYSCFVGYTVVHPFTPLGKNLELLLVCDKKDLESWQKQNLPLSIVTRLKEASRTEVNHIRYVRVRAVRCSALFLCIGNINLLSEHYTEHLLDCSALPFLFCIAVDWWNDAETEDMLRTLNCHTLLKQILYWHSNTMLEKTLK